MKPDVIILGGGPNGLAMALALGGWRLPQPLQVLVLDARDPQHLPIDMRGTAITRSTQAMFDALGVWESLGPLATEMRDVIVTDGAGSHQDRPALLSFATAAGESAAASMVQNRHLAACLLDAVLRSPCIHLRGGFSFAHYETKAAHITIEALNGDSYRAPLLIAADGRHSRVRQQTGIKLNQQDYGQTALSFSIAHSEPHHHLAEEHFSSQGVFAVLPLQGETCSIVWGTTPAEAQRLLALDDTDFTDALQQQMGNRLGHVSLLGKRAAFPLVMQIAADFIAPHIALIGDAAHAIHPLAGLGLNLGFKDAAALADCVVQALRRGEDIGGPLMLERYQKRRRFDTVMTTLAMDGMNALFVNDNEALRPLRQAGLRMVDQWPTLKNLLMQQAAGTSPDMPRLLQGLLPG
jgi:2-octaprenyl-6-methoxyphenol hydroxylase